MLILFFTIIFLAELIVAGWIISKIRLADNMVCTFNTQLTGVQPRLKENLIKTKEAVTILHAKFDCIIKSISDKKNHCENLIKNKALVHLGLWFVKLPYKRLISIIEMFFTIGKFLKNL